MCERTPPVEPEATEGPRPMMGNPAPFTAEHVAEQGRPVAPAALSSTGHLALSAAGHLALALRKWGVADHDTHALLSHESRSAGTLYWISDSTTLRHDLHQAALMLEAQDRELASRFGGFDLVDFSAENRARSEAPNGFRHRLGDWSLSDWMTATLGELGEAANIAKKLNRVRDGIPGNLETEAELRASLADEIADAAIYLDLMAQAAGISLAQAIRSKFDQTSAKIGYAASAQSGR